MNLPPSISDYAFLSDCQSAALVSKNGSIDWWCVPRFDSPSVFGRLLDPDAGHWSLSPLAAFTVTRSYVASSLILVTRFQTEDGIVEVRDGLLFDEESRGHEIGRRVPHVLVRTVRGISGDVFMQCDVRPRFEYGLTTASFESVDGGMLARGGPVSLLLHGNVGWNIEQRDAAVATFTASAGTSHQLVLACATDYQETPSPFIADDALGNTQRSWPSWAESHNRYNGEYAEAVNRSITVLQGLTYAPSGAVIAAATTSIPEEIGKDKNWDYRFGWLRDITFTARAQWIAACPNEALSLFEWVARSMGKIGEDGLQIMYGVEGERDLTEHDLSHLAGFRASKPVRIGNDAWDQRQLDVLGELLDVAYLLRDSIDQFGKGTQDLLVAIANQAARSWSQPDAGMWEARDQQRHYLSSKVMCWVALDRAVRLTPRLGEGADPARWAAVRDEIRNAILTRGWNEKVMAFTGAFESDHLDASVLLMPLVGFLDADDPRMHATIETIHRELSEDGFVYRWKGDNATFTLCSFWMVECLALAGDLPRARANFEKVLEYSNDLQLFSEEFDVHAAEQLGNFPQAFSHVGVINAAWRITELSRPESEEKAI